jgi:hypothetical protein
MPSTGDCAMSGRDGNLVEQRSVIVVDIPDPTK